jgi:acyl-CoA thioester hydrolase
MTRPHAADQPRFLVEVPLRVQAYDIDVVGIVSNIAYVRWLEDLRQAWCDAHYPTDRMFAQGFVPAIGSTHVEYKRAIVFGDRVAGRIWFEGFRGQRWHFGFEIVVGERIAAAARQSGIFLSVADRTIRQIPDDMLERFGKRPSPAPE